MSKIEKLGLGIVAFEGTEHIKNITYEIRNSVDYIVVCLQKLSYHGDPIPESDVKEVEHLFEIGLVDRIIWFEPDLSYKQEKHDDEYLGKQPRLIETNKRNYILEHLQTNGCTHSLVTDSDEFYDKIDFIRAKKLIEDNDMKITYCQYVNYWRDYRHYLVWPFPSYVPFICESSFRFEFACGCFDRPCDPTRIYKITDSSVGFHILAWKSIKMHHFSWIRLDIRKKINSWSSKNYFKNPIMFDVMYKKYMNWKEYENAFIMFNVPKNQVCVHQLDKAYIKPKYRLNERP